MPIYSYPSVFALGHKMIADIFSGPVVIEEKVDGSQFSFGIIDGELQCRSKGKQMIIDAPEKMFKKAVDTVKDIAPALIPGRIYRCEYLEKPKHNVLSYARVPKGNLVLFDVATGNETYLSLIDKYYEAERIGLEYVPALAAGEFHIMDELVKLLDTTSFLGGTKIEGFVVKNYNLFTAEKKIAIGKYVSEAFKEVQGGEWKKNNPSSVDIITALIQRYRTDARWEKAIQHLRDAGTLEGSPRDIGALIKEIPTDIQKECEDEIKQALWSYAWDKIRRGVVSGFPEWYKQRLAEQAFEGKD
jgi:hypothetical protein